MGKIDIKYRLAARTDAAGKYDPDAPQEGNEDNYGLITDITNPDSHAEFDKVTNLGKYGVLLFLADGMGGHNAGEVASRIAVDTVYEAFAEGRIDDTTAATHESRSKYMEEVIREADNRIRSHAQRNKECDGMGSTLIIAWLCGDELTVSWCGDSRAYLYRVSPKPHIFMVSEDHSYVQELVKRGVIPYEATFGHPRGNIVTRCLGGNDVHSEPESRMTKVGKGDIILLCSDGLSGVVFDDGRLFDGQPITPENICDTITMHHESLRECGEFLFAAAERQNWYDNVTAILCEVVDGPVAPNEPPTPISPSYIPAPALTEDNQSKNKKKPWIVIAAILIVVAAAVAVFFLYTPDKEVTTTKDTVETTEEQTDPISVSEIAPTAKPVERKKVVGESAPESKEDSISKEELRRRLKAVNEKSAEPSDTKPSLYPETVPESNTHHKPVSNPGSKPTQAPATNPSAKSTPKTNVN